MIDPVILRKINLLRLVYFISVIESNGWSQENIFRDCTMVTTMKASLVIMAVKTEYLELLQWREC